MDCVLQSILVEKMGNKQAHQSVALVFTHCRPQVVRKQQLTYRGALGTRVQLTEITANLRQE